MTTQRQDKELKQTERRSDTSTSGSSTSSTTTYHTVPGVSAHDLEEIRQTYEGVVKCYLNNVTARDIERAIEGGLEASAIMDALYQTAMAPRPSHYYFRAILKRYMAEGITSRQKAEEQRWKRKHDMEISRAGQLRAWYTNPALNYQQRDYTDDEFGDDFFIDLDKYAEGVKP